MRLTSPITSSSPARRTGLAAGLVALTATVVVAGTATSGTADPGDGFVPFGSSLLIQSEDLVDVGVRLDTETVSLAGGQALSSCTGETTMYTITGTDIDVGGTWTSQLDHDQLLTESVSRGATKARTTAYVAKIRHQLRSCQHEPKGHFRYGKAHRLVVGSGAATYFVVHDGDGQQDGGVAVVRNGTQFGVVEVTSPSNTSGPVIRSLTRSAVRRLG